MQSIFTKMPAAKVDAHQIWEWNLAANKVLKLIAMPLFFSSQ